MTGADNRHVRWRTGRDRGRVVMVVVVLLIVAAVGSGGSGSGGCSAFCGGGSLW